MGVTIMQIQAVYTACDSHNDQQLTFFNASYIVLCLLVCHVLSETCRIKFEKILYIIALISS